ncbi:hydrolase, alpha/beta fold domain containing protein [Acanthamoeba castellanii str. Neff]|uniref:Hydrolase, alpha/beta fold domain containing protein n=1 Tax=Acanthamoeba castellanii (strain ATCC 30010 / Neff) TaxID=1257118 RepID=L8GLB5_ACACF|nr:hydrolase, alpha/beta fold domain containing protein [Acanthamoeba castellanii str. Neff]ELR13870.1 hydrolase, alpha/beta fold domain containing protein [Acanthamoeba castellanii str. Neff]
MESAKSWLSTLKSELISGKMADLLPKSLVGKLLLCGAVLAGGNGLWYTLVYFRRAVQRPRLSYQHNANFLFYTTHIATVAGTYFRSMPTIHYRRDTLSMDDGGQLCLDWVLDDGDDTDVTPNKPTVIIFHGLNGGSSSVYVRHVINAIKDQLGRDKIRVVVMNNRGAGGSELLTPKGYCGAYTEDARVAIRHDEAPLIALGYSLGANIMLKYVGEEGENVPLNGAISVSNPLDFKASSFHLETMPLYNAVLTKGCIGTFSRHAHIFAQHEELEIEAIYQIFGYETVDEYYDAASSVNYIQNVAVPTLILHAMDDPIVPAAALDRPREEAEKNPNTILATVPYGGHVGFPEGWLPIGDKLSWADRVVAEFIHALVAPKQVGSSSDA